MKEYIINIKFKNWQNQLWFMNENNEKIEEEWNNSLDKLEEMKKEFEDSMEYQSKVIEYLKNLGFILVKK